MAFKMNPKSPALKSMGRYATPQAIKPAVTSPAKQTASQRKNLPEVIVKAIAAKSPAKQVGKDAGDTAAFEKSKAIELRMEKKMEKATGNKKKQARIANRTNKKMARKVPRAKRRADNKGYDMENFDGTTTRLKGKNEKSSNSPAKQKVNRDDGVQVKEVPKVVGEEVEKATKFVGKEAKKVSKWGKKLFKKIGNIKLTKTKKEKLKKAEEKVSKLKTKTKQ